ncbi:MAG: T9SS type A sorting domain-containing protein [Rhodothermaceae bacterium]|nr:T9SS type A sorting domain-containing protein [Rhodothermaceae bacterium]
MDEFIPSTAPDSPLCFTFHSDGFLYVCSPRTGRGRILKYDAFTGKYIGGFIDGYRDNVRVHPNNILFSPQGELLVTRFTDGQVEKYDGKTGKNLGVFIDGIVGSHFHSLGGFIFGPDGNLYGSRQETEEIWRYDGNTGEFIDSFIPAGRGGLEYPLGLKFGPDNNLYVISTVNTKFIRPNDAKILKYDGQTGAFISEFIVLEFQDPRGLTFHDLQFGVNGNLFVLNGYLNEIREFDGFTGELKNILAQIDETEDPLYFDFGPDGHLYVAINHGSKDPESYSESTIRRYNGSTGEFMDFFVKTQNGGLDSPNSLTWGPDDNLYVSSRGSNNNILRYDGSTGEFIDVFVSKFSSNFEITFGPDGNLYVSGSIDDDIRRFAGDTGEFLDIFVQNGSGGLRDPKGIIFSPDGNLFVASSNGMILIFNGITGEFIRPFGDTESNRLNGPEELLFDSNGDLIVSTNHGIMRYDSEREVLLSMSSGPILPKGQLAIGPDDKIYSIGVAENRAPRIERFDKISGDFIDVFVPERGGGLWFPKDLIFDSEGRLYVTDAMDRILRFEGPSTSSVSSEVETPVANEIERIITYPNPFSQQFQIEYELSSYSSVRLEIYDLLGRLIETIVSGEQPAGRHTASFHAETLTDGVYFLELITGSQRSSKKIVKRR